MEMYRPVPTAGAQDPRARFLAEVARGLAGLSHEDLEAGCLTVPFGLSAWIKRAGIDLAAAADALMVLRSALLDSSGLEEGCEPVPLMARDATTAVISLAVYLHGLLQRAANFSRTSRLEMANAAVHSLT